MISLSRYVVAALLAITAIPACRSTPSRSAPRGAIPPAASEASHPHTPMPTVDTVRPRHSTADVRFMQGMIAHHAQALAMTSLVPARSNRADIRLLAERIDVSQRDEIALMQRWLVDRGEDVPSSDAQHMHHDGAAHQALMPGMLTDAELTELAKAQSPAFDRLFLQFMIRHHEGALVMVSELLATSGAAQDSEVFRFASDVDADQRAEIARMRALLGAQGASTPHR